MKPPRYLTIDETFILFLITGIFLELAFFLGFASSWLLVISFVFILILTLNILFWGVSLTFKADRFKKLVAGLILLLLLINFLPVFTPETGFDALWYHLPITRALVNQLKIVYIPSLYQSLNPLLAELYFASGYAFLKDLGVQLVSYCFMVFLLAATYKVSRFKLTKQESLLITFVVAGFQVVSWQASSAYVDVAKAFFELAGLYFSQRAIKGRSGEFVIAALFFSASLATKLFSLFMLPTFIYALLSGQKLKKASAWLSLVILLLLLPMPFYIFAFLNTGNPFYSFAVHTNKLAEIGGEGQLSLYLFKRVVSLPSSLIKLGLARDYVWPGLGLFIPFIMLKTKPILKDRFLRVLVVFSLSQWGIWWFVPPLSTRYALSGFVGLLILGVVVIKTYYQKLFTPLLYLLLLSGLVMMLPRVYVLKRNLPYLLKKETKREYLKRFYDGNVDDKIDSWYGYKV